jgi:hypothetical protein
MRVVFGFILLLSSVFSVQAQTPIDSTVIVPSGYPVVAKD